MTANTEFHTFITKVLQSFEEGDFRRHDLGDHKFNTQAELEVIKALENNQRALLSISSQANVIALGDYDAEVTPRGDKDELGKALFSMTETLRDVGKVAAAIAVGDFSTKVEVKGSNDKLGSAINQMVDNFKEITDQANVIAQGDYDAEIAPRGDKDELGKALLSMTKNLRQSAADSRRQNWLKNGQTGLADHIRGDLDLPTLCKNTITFLCKYLDAQVGVFYLADVDNTLRMNASYAFTRRKDLASEIKLGEGLIGQAALEKEAIVISDVPEDYIAINSGLGKAVPRNMLVVPVLLEGSLMGMLEVGSFNAFNDEQIELLKLVNENIAVAIKSSRDGGRMKDLLEESQRATEELQSQQEELRSANEQLEEQTQSLKSSEEELKAQSEELQQSNEQLEEKSDFLERQKAEIEKQNSAIERSRQDIMVKAEELELSSQYKSEFLANMSHELRTPLNSLLILSKTLADNRQGNLTEDQVESASIVHSGGQELLELINDILDLSKVEAGKMNVNIEAIRVGDLKNDLVGKFRPLTEEKGLELNLEIEPGAPGTIKTDNQRIQQILKNLLSNAIKFTSHGSITVSIHPPASDTRFTQSALTTDNSVGISVTDTGIGIAANKQREIFEAFQQADGSTSRNYGGTGLGLTISRELAKLLGGEIHLQSEEGAGSTFTLYLPLDGAEGGQSTVSRETQAQPPPLNTPIPMAAKSESDTIFLADDRNLINPDDKSLLIIEHDRAFAQILLRLARDMGFKCLSAGDGSSGLYLAQKYQPSGITLDLGLPDIDGLAVLDHLKHDLATRHIPVHIMSGRDSRTASLQAGALDFLQKPVTEEGIEASLQKIEQLLVGDMKRVLVVEDDDNNRKAIIKLIGNRKIEITDVADGQSAMDILRTEQFDCIVLDLELPDMSGFDVLQELGNEKDIHLPPVIIHTGRELTEEQQKELTQYSDSIVVKGAASPERLLDEVSMFLHSVASTMPKKQQDMIRMMHQPDQAFDGKRVLLVDDDVRNTFALSKELREHGIEVILADNGQLALEQLDHNADVDLVLMDIMMPVMDGHEAMGKIRQQEKYKNLPIIALTALAMPEDRAKCIDSGANDYLPKPVDVDRLLSMMRIWLFNPDQERRGEGRPWEDEDNNDQSTDDNEQPSASIDENLPR